MNESRDKKAVRLAVTGLSVATAIVLIGICLILAFGSTQVTYTAHVDKTRTGRTRVGRTRVGSANAARGHSTLTSSKTTPREVPAVLWALAAALAGALVGLLIPDPSSTNPASWSAMGLLAVVILVVFADGGVGGSPELEALVAASGAALIAILAPSPAAPQFDA